MKISVIASSAKILQQLQSLLEKNPGSDQFIFLQRHGQDLGLDRIDLFSTNILILDSSSVGPDDLRAISACTREHVNPAILYLSETHTEAELLSLMRAGVTEVIGLPLVAKELQEAVERIRARNYISSAYRPKGKVISFMSCKGGAGATFLATNLGYILATEAHQKVLFIDLHMQYGDAAFYLSSTVSQRTLADIVKQSGLDSSSIASASMQIAEDYYLLQAPQSPEKASGIQVQHVDNLITVAIQEYDFVIIDLPHSLDAISMKVLDRSYKIFPVMQPMVPYIRAMGNTLRLFGMLGYESNKVNVLLNRMEQNIALSLASMEDVIQKKIERIVPNDFVNAAESVNNGIPVIKVAPQSGICSSLTDIAKDLSGVAVSIKKASFLNKLFG